MTSGRDVQAGNNLGITIRLEYSVASGAWTPYMEYPISELQYCHDFMPMAENGTDGPNGAPYELIPNETGSTAANQGYNGHMGSLWNDNRNAAPGGEDPGRMTCWDGRTPAWGFPLDVGPARLFLDGFGSSSAPVTMTMNTISPLGTADTTYAANSHSGDTGTTGMENWGWYEPTGGLLLGMKEQNLFSGSTTAPTTDYYADPDGTVRRAVGAFTGGTGSTGNTSGGANWVWTVPTTLGLPLASTSNVTNTSATSNQSQSRPIILHRPYRSVAELGYVFSNIPFKNISFSTQESPYSALLDTFCINEDYRPDAWRRAGSISIPVRPRSFRRCLPERIVTRRRAWPLRRPARPRR